MSHNNAAQLLEDLDKLEQMESNKKTLSVYKRQSKPQKIQEPVKDYDVENKPVKFKLIGARLHPIVHAHLKSIIGLKGTDLQKYHCNHYEELLKKHGVDQSIIDLLKLPVTNHKKT